MVFCIKQVLSGLVTSSTLYSEVKCHGAENDSDNETDNTQRRSQNQLMSNLGLELGIPDSHASDPSQELKKGREKMEGWVGLIGDQMLAKGRRRPKPYPKGW